MMVAIYERLVSASRALILFKPYVVFTCPNLTSIAFLSPDLIWLGSIVFEGRPMVFQQGQSLILLIFFD